MKILGLDVSTKIGWALARGEGHQPEVLHSGVIRDKSQKLTGFPRLSYLGDQVNGLVRDSRPDLVMVEGYSYGSHNSTIKLVEVGTVVRYYLHQMEMPYYDVPPATLKKFVTGRGNAKKELILMFMLKVWGLEYDNDDEADAAGLALLGLAAFREISVPDARFELAHRVIQGEK